MAMPTGNGENPQVYGQWTIDDPLQIVNHLLSKNKLTFDNAMELAQVMESAEHDTQQLKAA